MVPYSLLHPVSSVCFEGKTHFSASRDLSFARSKYFKLPEPESCGDVWSIKPPDFSLKLYRSLSVPQRKERKTNVNLSVAQPSEAKRKSRIFLTYGLHESNRRKEPPKFITSYRPPDAAESELMFVKTGKYPSEPYKNPKPHNFRPVRFWKHNHNIFNLIYMYIHIIRSSKSSQRRHQSEHKEQWSLCGCNVQFKHKVVLNTKQQTREGNLTTLWFELFISAWWDPSRHCKHLWERSW